VVEVSLPLKSKKDKKEQKRGRIEERRAKGKEEK
jgi:hypothetical protein